MRNNQGFLSALQVLPMVIKSTHKIMRLALKLSRAETSNLSRSPRNFSKKNLASFFVFDMKLERKNY